MLKFTSPSPGCLISVKWLMPLVLLGMSLSLKAQGLTLTLTKVAGEKNEITVAAKRILTEAYRNIDIRLEFEDLPSKRALLLSNKGITDGELIRIDNIDVRYPDLIKVPTSYMSLNHMAWTKDALSLNEKKPNLAPYIIGYHRGYLAAEDITKGLTNYVAGNIQQVFKMLDSGRIEVAIATEYTGRSVVIELELHGIKMSPTRLATTPVYHYLHKKNQHLVAKISESLSHMQQSGRIEDIITNVRLEFETKYGQDNSSVFLSQRP